MSGVINSYMLGFYLGIMMISSLLTLTAACVVTYYGSIIIAAVVRLIKHLIQRK